jgi:hypothetical protein
MVFAAVLRWATFEQSLWLDELHTSWVVAGGWRDIAPRAAAGNQGPVYFYLVWIVSQLRGANEATLRSVSGIAGVLFVGALGALVRCWTRSAILGIVAATLATFDPHALFYSREARPYALVQLLGLFHVHRFVLRSVAPSAARRAGWIVLSWLMWYTHYTGALLIAAELAAVPFWVSRRRWLPTVRGLCLDLFVVALGAAWAFPQLAEIAARRANWAQFVRRVPIQSIWTLFPCQRYVLPAVVIGTLLAWTYRARFGRVAHARRFRRLFLLVLCWYLVPAIIAWALTWFDHARLFWRRYLIVIEAALFTSATLGGVVLGRVAWRLVYAVSVTAWAATYWIESGAALWTEHSPEDWRRAVALVRDDPATRQWPVFLRGGLIEDGQLRHTDEDAALRAYCLFPVHGLYSLRAHQGMLRAVNSYRSVPPRAAWLSAAQQAGGAWLIYRGSAAGAQVLAQSWEPAWQRAVGAVPTARIDAVRGVALVRWSF